jgi:FkbM family methyltransferase
MDQVRIKEELSGIIGNIKNLKYSMKLNELKEAKSIILYGAGIEGIKVLNELLKVNISPDAFLDIRAELLGEIHNIPVYQPKIENLSHIDTNNTIIILTVKPLYSRNEKIIKTLNEIGFNKIFLATDMFDFYGFTNNQIKNFENTKKEILDCANQLEDYLSYEIFKNFIKAHALREYQFFCEPSGNVKYFDEEFIKLINLERFVDCGAYQGDTFSDLMKQNQNVESVVLFEPDKNSFNQLTQNLASSKVLKSPEIILYPLGVWKETAILKANMNMELNSHISDEGNISIQCVALDDTLINYKPTYIKMDIEGVELEAIEGAKDIIVSEKPNLVISIYHKLSDMWEILKKLSAWNLGYKFYIRTYGYGGNSTLLYAIRDTK